jgi:hypothetical protein
MKNQLISVRQFAGALAAFTLLAQAGCATTVSEDDRWLWEAGSLTNAPSTNAPAANLNPN